MVNKVNPERMETTISLPKDLKQRLRCYAQPTKVTKSGQCYETDKQVLTRILDEYYQSHPLSKPESHSTYPKKRISDVVETVESIPVYSSQQFG